MLPLDRDSCSLPSPGAAQVSHQGLLWDVSLQTPRGHLQCFPEPLCSASLPAAHIHLSLPTWRSGTSQRSRDGLSSESWNDGSILAAQEENPSYLLLIPVAATEIHPKPWPHHQPCKELKKLPSKSSLLKTDTPNLALELFPGAFQAAKAQRGGSTARYPLPTVIPQPGTCRALPAAGIPQGNGMWGNGIRAPLASPAPRPEPAAPAVGPCPTLWEGLWDREGAEGSAVSPVGGVSALKWQ